MHVIYIICLVCLIGNIITSTIESTPIKMSDDEPGYECLHKDFRISMVGQELYVLGDLNLFNSQHESNQYYKCSTGQLVNETSKQQLKHDFKFNSTEHIRRTMDIYWRIPADERAGLHYYDKAEEKLISGGPHVNQRTCGLMLDHMLYINEKHNGNFHESSHYSLFKIIDSFGVPGPAILQGSFYWDGSYDQCTRSRLTLLESDILDMLHHFNYSSIIHDQLLIDSTVKEMMANGGVKSFNELDFNSNQLISDHYKLNWNLVPMRYCYAHLRYPSWPNSSHYIRHMTFRSALCLPESCDSLSLDLYQDKLMKLMKLNYPERYHDFYLTSLYCLPDKESPITDPFQSKSTVCFLIFIFVWSSLILCSSLYYLANNGLNTSRTADADDDDDRRSKNCNSTKSDSLSWARKHGPPTPASRNRRISRTVSADCCKGASHCDTVMNASRNKLKKIVQNDDQSTTNKQMPRIITWFCLFINIEELFFDKKKKAYNQSLDQTERKNQSKTHSINNVNLSSINGCKVILSTSVIAVHAFIFFSGSVANPFESQYLNTKTVFAHMQTLPSAAVDAFFVMSGLLTTYCVFKADNDQNDNTRLFKFHFWLVYLIARYLRMIPTYAIVFWFTKTYFRFIGSGPYWDYGTSNSSMSVMCQDESWAHIWLPQANLMFPHGHCIITGWYIASDIQFALISPIFLILLKWRPRLAYTLMTSFTIVTMGIHVNYFLTAASDTTVAIEFSVERLTSLTIDSSVGYVDPRYRITSYVIGLMAGHILYCYECGKIANWPKMFVKLAPKIIYFQSILLLLAPRLLIMLSKSDTQYYVKRLIASIMDGVFHTTIGLNSALFLLLLLTGYMPKSERIFSMSIWSPFARASLSTLVVHTHVIHYVLGSFTTAPHLSETEYLRLCVYVLVVTYIVSIIVCLLFEAPIRKISSGLILDLFITQRICARQHETKEINVSNANDNSSKTVADNEDHDDFDLGIQNFLAVPEHKFCLSKTIKL